MQGGKSTKNLGNDKENRGIYLLVTEKCVSLQTQLRTKGIIMTSPSQKIQSTPMAPYIELMEKMSDQDKVAVATFLVAMVPHVKVVEEQADHKTNADIIREKYKSLKRSPRVKSLMRLREEAARFVDLDDERTRHILGVEK